MVYSNQVVLLRGRGERLALPNITGGSLGGFVRQRRPVIHNDYLSLPHRKGLPEGHAELIREIVVPVIREDRITAILGIGNKPDDYTQQDMDAVSLLADLAWDIAERKQAEEALACVAERARHIAGHVQQTLVPTHPLPQPAGFEIATKYQPALREAEVCGDFYDLFDISNGKIGIVIGDMVGKGLLAPRASPL